MNLNFMLTEISLQLLGNKFYDSNGCETDNLRDLFTSHNSELRQLPVNGQQKRQSRTNDNLMQMIGIPNLQNSSNDYVEKQYKGFLDNQRIRIEALSPAEHNVINTAQVQKDLCEMRIKTQQEFVKITGHSKKMKDIYLDTLPVDTNRNLECSKYNEEERTLLVNEYNRLLYMLKYILADVNNRLECEEILEVIEGIKDTLKHL